MDYLNNIKKNVLLLSILFRPTSLEQILNKFPQAQIVVQNADKKNKNKNEEIQ